jgi:hypothetical protein
MTRRITRAHVEAKLDRLNTLAGTPLTPCCPHSTEVKYQLGCYHLDSAYNGYRIVQISTLSGGTSDVSKHGYQTPRELSAFLDAFIEGFGHGWAYHDKRAAKSRATSKHL